MASLAMQATERNPDFLEQFEKVVGGNKRKQSESQTGGRSAGRDGGCRQLAFPVFAILLHHRAMASFGIALGCTECLV
jgi:hypothetical protein